MKSLPGEMGRFDSLGLGSRVLGLGFRLQGLGFMGVRTTWRPMGTRKRLMFVLGTGR